MRLLRAPLYILLGFATPPMRTAQMPHAKIATSDDGICFGRECVSWAAAFARGRRGGWQASLPPMTTNVSARCRLQGRADCPHVPPGYICAPPGQQRCSDLAELRWPMNLSKARAHHAHSACDGRHGRFRGSVLSVHLAWPPPKPPASDVLEAALSFTTNSTVHRMNWVPVLVQELRAHPPPGELPLFGVPCSSARLEDGAILRTFFSDSNGRPSRGGTFLEMGAYDGALESTTSFFEQCLGWRGILIEAQPNEFSKVLGNRPYTLNMRMAACRNHGSVRFTTGGTAARVRDPDAKDQVGLLHLGKEAPAIDVRCGPLGDYLELLGVHRLDFFSLDVEGSELEVIQSLRKTSSLSIGVFQVEVRGDGLRGKVMKMLMRMGFSYVGQIRARPSVANEIIDDIFVNLTHMQLHFPRSCALAPPPVEARGASARGASTGRRSHIDQYTRFPEQLELMVKRAQKCCRPPQTPGGSMGHCFCGV